MAGTHAPEKAVPDHQQASAEPEAAAETPPAQDSEPPKPEPVITRKADFRPIPWRNPFFSRLYLNVGWYLIPPTVLAVLLSDRLLDRWADNVFAHSSVVLVIVLLVTGAICATILRPLNVLLRAQHARMRGDRERSFIPLKNDRGDEIGDLMRGHNQMLRGMWEAEDRFRGMVEGLEAVVYEANASTRRFTYISSRITDLLGYPREQLTANAGSWDQHGETHESEYRMTAADGREVWLRDIVRAVDRVDPKTGATYRLLSGILLDITDRKQVETELAETHTQQQATLNNLGDSIYVVDRDLRIQLVNDHLMDWMMQLGIAGNLAGKSIADAFPFVSDRALQEYEQVLQTGEPVVTEETIELGMGTIVTETRKIPVLEDGQVKSVITVLRDITEKKRILENLQGECDRAQSYLELAGSVIVALDRQGCVTLINRAACTLLGRETQEVAGQDWFAACVPHEHQAAARQTFERVLAGEDDAGDNDRQVIATRSGESRTIEWQWTRLRDQSGDVIGTLMSGTDVTETERYQHELQVRSAELDHSLQESKCLCAISELLHTARPSLPDVLGDLVKIVPSGTRRPAETFVRLRVDGETYTTEPFRETGQCLSREILVGGDSAGRIDIFTEAVAGGTQGQVDVSIDEKLVAAIVGLLSKYLERVRSQTQLEETTRFLDSIFESIPYAVTIKEVDSLRYVRANQATHSVLGIAPDDLIGKVDSDHWSPDEAASIEIADRRAIQGHASVAGDHSKLATPHLGERQFRTTRWRLHRDNANSDYLMSITEDITAQQEVERDLRMTKLGVDRISDAIYWLDANGCFVRVNESACTALGRSSDELLSLSVFDIDPLMTPDVWPEHWQQLRDNGSLTLRSVHRRSDGTEYPVEITASLVVFEGAEFNCAVARDVTQRQLAERMSDENRARLMAMLDAARAGVLLVDAETGGIVEASAMALRMIGLDLDSVRGHRPADFIAADRNDPADTDAGHDTGIHPVETVLHTAAGTEIPILNMSVRVRVMDTEYRIESFLDITAQREREHSVAARERYYQRLLDSVPEVVAVFGSDGRLRHANAPFCDLSCESADEMTGFDLFARIHDEDRPLLEDAIMHLNSADTRIVPFKLRMHTATMDIREIEGTIEKLPDDASDCAYVMVAREVVKQVPSVEETQAASLQETADAEDHNSESGSPPHTEPLGAMPDVLQQLESTILLIQELSVSLTGPATPSSAGQGEGEAEGSSPAQEELSSALQQILAGTHRLSAVCRNGLATSPEAPATGPAQDSSVDVNRVIQDVLNAARPEFDCVADVHLELQTDPAMIHGEARVFSQVFTLILADAVNSIANCDEILLGVRGRITVRSRQEDGHIVIEVTDTGQGRRTALFEAMTALEGTQPGQEITTEQGLSYAMSLVAEQLGGVLHVQSDDGPDRTVSVRIPAALEPSPRGIVDSAQSWM